MIQSLQEVCRLNSSPLQVSRESDVIRGVKILGTESRNGRTYRPAALARAVALYEGAKVNVNHPKAGPHTPRDYQDRIGVVRNVTFRDGGLFADLQYNPKHQLAEQLAWDAEHAPENVGLSHNVEARVSRQDERLMVDEILRVRSIDLVADPATTRSLFESAPEVGKLSSGSPFNELRDTQPEVMQTVLESLTPSTLQALRPDLVAALTCEQAAELASLREAVQTQRTLEERKGRARALLREYELPDPEIDPERARTLLGEGFVERLCGAADEGSMRQLIRERAELIAGVRSMPSDKGAWPQRPVSRDPRQMLIDWDAGESTERFVRAITG